MQILASNNQPGGRVQPVLGGIQKSKDWDCYPLSGKARLCQVITSKLEVFTALPPHGGRVRDTKQDGPRPAPQRPSRVSAGGERCELKDNCPCEPCLSDHVDLNNKFKRSEDREAPRELQCESRFWGEGRPAWRNRGGISFFSSAEYCRVRRPCHLNQRDQLEWAVCKGQYS